MLTAIQSGASRIGFRWTSISAEPLGEAVWLFASGEVALLDVPEHPAARYRMTGILERVGDGWRWRLFHGSEPNRG